MATEHLGKYIDPLTDFGFKLVMNRIKICSSAY